MANAKRYYPLADKGIVFKMVGGVMAITAIGVVVMGYVLPRHWKVSRDILVTATPTELENLVADFNGWKQWIHDPKRGEAPAERLSEPATGVGASRIWEPKPGVEVKMTINESHPAERMCFEVSRSEDDISSRGCFEFSEHEGMTKIIWTDEGDLSPLFGGYFLAHVSETLGLEMESALKRLKTISEELHSAGTTSDSEKSADSNPPAPAEEKTTEAEEAPPEAEEKTSEEAQGKH